MWMLVRYYPVPITPPHLDGEPLPCTPCSARRIPRRPCHGRPLHLLRQSNTRASGPRRPSIAARGSIMPAAFDGAIGVQTWPTTTSPAVMPSPNTNLQCCCGQPDCVFLKHSCAVLEGVEKDVHTAAKLGQVSSQRLSLPCSAGMSECVPAQPQSADHVSLPPVGPPRAPRGIHGPCRARPRGANGPHRAARDGQEAARGGDGQTRRGERGADQPARAAEHGRFRLGDSHQGPRGHAAVVAADGPPTGGCRRPRRRHGATPWLPWSWSRRPCRTPSSTPNPRLAPRSSGGGRAERSISELQAQLERMEREASEERERHREVLDRMERQRALEKSLNTAAARLKGAAAVTRAFGDGNARRWRRWRQCGFPLRPRPAPGQREPAARYGRAARDARQLQR